MDKPRQTALRTQPAAKAWPFAAGLIRKAGASSFRAPSSTVRGCGSRVRRHLWAWRRPCRREACGLNRGRRF